MWHTCLYYFEVGSCYVAQAGLELKQSFFVNIQVAGAIGVYQLAWLVPFVKLKI
jgi:hypothetical protein